MQWMRSISQIAIALVIIAASVVIAIILVFSKSDIQKNDFTSKALLVNTIKAEPSSEQIKFTAFGTVIPHRKLIVHPELSGTIIYQSPNLIAGGMLDEGDIMLMIDPRDYKLLIQQAEAEVTRAEFELKVEEGRQIVAKREWELLSPTLKTANIGVELALRKPHLEEKKAMLEAAKSRLEKANIDLERTTLSAPFNAIVIEENTESGQYITPQTEIATLVDSETFHVRVSVPFNKLKWIKIPAGKVIVTQTVGEKSTIKRPGQIMRLLGDVDPQGRLARLEVAIKDPLRLKNGNRSKPLLLGTYVSVEFFGPVIKNVYKVPRIAIHDSDDLWIKNKENKLEFRQVKILFSDSENVFITQGLEKGEEIVTSPISLPIPGTELRTENE
ncbi:MAG: Solvent efflux pump periplasmic linker SrpA [Chlamydiae bacterium]|nr:Solvent efflux pump periplasmic linker SrpA [Chlamydiota bacterium]